MTPTALHSQRHPRAAKEGTWRGEAPQVSGEAFRTSRTAVFHVPIYYACFRTCRSKNEEMVEG
eukprot:5993183-Prymnesium_polylepis.1